MESIAKRVVSRIYGKRRGWVFTPNHFSDLGKPDSVGKALKALCERETIRKLARGLYDYPRTHPDLGRLTPKPDDIAKALAGRDAIRLQPAGAYAANLLGLSNQVPAKIVFLTDGKSRTVTVGTQTISLKRTSPRTMSVGTTTGLVLQALKYLGKDRITSSEIHQLRRRLTKSQVDELLRDRKLVPAWVRIVINEIAKNPSEENDGSVRPEAS